LALINTVNMSQDITADGLNQIMNARRAGKAQLVLARHSKLLLGILGIAKLRGYVKDFSVEGKQLTITLGGILKCQAIKPRYTVTLPELAKYEKRYLPAKELGILILSTSKGLMTNSTAREKHLGGCLIAYFY